MLKYKVTYKKNEVNVEHTFNDFKKATKFIGQCFEFGFTNVKIERFNITEK